MSLLSHNKQRQSTEEESRQSAAAISNAHVFTTKQTQSRLYDTFWRTINLQGHPIMALIESDLKVKNWLFSLLHPDLILLFGVILSEFQDEPYLTKKAMMGVSDGEDLMILAQFVQSQYHI